MVTPRSSVGRGQGCPTVFARVPLPAETGYLGRTRAHRPKCDRLTPARGPEHGSPLVVALKASWRNACYKRDSSLVARSEAPRAQVRHSQSCCRSDHFPGTAGEHYLSSRRKSPDHAVDREASSQTEGFRYRPRRYLRLLGGDLEQDHHRGCSWPCQECRPSVRVRALKRACRETPRLLLSARIGAMLVVAAMLL